MPQDQYGNETFEDRPDLSNENIDTTPASAYDEAGTISLADVSSRERTDEELVGVNDGEPRVDCDPNTLQASLIRRRQWKAWHYPRHLRQAVRGEKPPSCPQCFGIRARCPIDSQTDGDNWRLCPHAQ